MRHPPPSDPSRSAPEQRGRLACRLLPALVPALMPVTLLALGACGRPADPAPGHSGTGSGPDSAAVPPAEGVGGLAVVDAHHPAHPGWRDLGSIPLGQVVTHVVELENREGRPLTIRSLRAGCACTQPSIAYRDDRGRLVAGDPRASGAVLTLPAGALAELTLQVDSRRAPIKNKPKRVNVRIVTDSDTSPYLTIEAQFVVEAPFQLGPERLDFGDVAQHGSGQASTRLIPLRDQLAVDVVSTPAGVEATLEPVEHLGQPAWELHATIEPPIELGLVEQVITVSTRLVDGGAAPPLLVPVRVHGVPDVEVEPARLVLRPAEPGAGASAEVLVHSNLAGHRFQLRAPRVDGPGSGLAAELVPATPDTRGRSSSWTVRLAGRVPEPAATEGSAPLPSGTLTVETDDPNLPQLAIPYVLLQPSRAD